MATKSTKTPKAQGAQKAQPAELKETWNMSGFVRSGKDFKFACVSYAGKDGESVCLMFTRNGAYYMTDSKATDRAWSKATIKSSFGGGRGIGLSFPMDIENAYPVVRSGEDGWVVVQKAVERKGLETYVDEIIARLDDIVRYCALSEVDYITAD